MRYRVIKTDGHYFPLGTIVWQQHNGIWYTNGTLPQIISDKSKLMPISINCNIKTL